MGNQKKLAILGANDAICLLIKKAKEFGYETHVFAWQCGDPGEKLADYFYPISIDKKDEILKRCRDIGVCGICSVTSDFATPTVNYVSRALGFPSNPERTDEVARNKYKMRCAFKEAGIYTPEFRQLGSDYEECAVEDIKYPVIVKPTDRWSSKGVTRVDRYEDLKSAVDYAVSESFDKRAIVESFMDGPEYSAECICQNGERHILAFTKKETTDYPHYIETGHRQPSDLTDEQKENATKTVLRALEALDIVNSAAHAEFRVLPSGEIGIIEIGARMGGDCIGTDLTIGSTGLDYIKMVIDVACGNALNFTPGKKFPNVTIRFIMNKSDYEEYLKRKETLHIIRESIHKPKFDHEVVDSNTRYGFYIFTEE